jgi:cytochrome c-type biogenesis protein CcmE
MLKKIRKYVIVIAANLVILVALLMLWTDELELTFNKIVRGIEVFKIAGFGVLTVIGIVILVNFYKRRNIKSQRLKIVIAVIVTLMLSSYLYIDYLRKVVDHVIINGQLRKQIAAKIQPAELLAYGTMARGLSIEEYVQIKKICGFPALPLEASNIQYKYSYDGFLPDYLLELRYELPVGMKVDTIDYVHGDFSRKQSCQIVGDRKIVSYSECEQ